MPLDPNIILQGRAPQITPPLELATGAMQLRNLGLAGQNAQITLEQNRRTLQDQKTIADLYRANTSPDGSVNHQGVIQGLAQAGLGDKIPAYQQQVATAAKDTTAASAAQFDLHKKILDWQANEMGTLASDPAPTYDKVNAALQRGVSGGLITPEQGAAAMRELPAPAQLHQYLVQKALSVMDASKRLELMAPQFQKVDTGAGVTTGTVDKLTGQFTPQGTLPKSLSPDTRANIAKDYAVAGLNPDGSLKASDSALVDQIGQGRIIPSARLQATPRGQALLEAVEKKYPGYDITTAEAKRNAAKAFTTGKEGTALRSIGTVTKHLDMLGGMVDALDNGNLTLLNKLGQTWSSQTGSTAPTNFDSAKEIVGQEVVKAIVAGGGGVAERAEASAALDKAKSPAQLKGVIQTYRTIMGAQHESLLQQRDAAGLSRSTLPNYTEGAANTSPLAAPAGPPVPIKSDADYAGLKSGTRFQAPDGTIRIKP